MDSIDRPQSTFMGHPRGLATLFFTEMWERFSYYGMRALLILFMAAPVASGGLGFDDKTAGAIYGLYTMAYIFWHCPAVGSPTVYLGLKSLFGTAESSLH